MLSILFCCLQIHVIRVCLPQEKKLTFLCAPRELLKKCLLPLILIILQSCYFDYRMSKPFACSRYVICFLLYSLDVVTCAKDHGFLRKWTFLNAFYVCQQRGKCWKKVFLGKIIQCISTKKHILRYMLVGCSREHDRSCSVLCWVTADRRSNCSRNVFQSDNVFQ